MSTSQKCGGVCLSSPILGCQTEIQGALWPGNETPFIFSPYRHHKCPVSYCVGTHLGHCSCGCGHWQPISGTWSPMGLESSIPGISSRLCCIRHGGLVYSSLIVLGCFSWRESTCATFTGMSLFFLTCSLSDIFLK